MAFGAWLRGHLSNRPILEIIEDLQKGDERLTMIIPSPYKLDSGDDAFLVKPQELASMLTPGFWMALGFWKDYKRYSAIGMFCNDYRKLTVQQKRVIELFDDCAELWAKDRPQAPKGRGL